MTKRNTIQRQLVIAAVRFLADHPTAEEVYDRITMEYPDPCCHSNSRKSFFLSHFRS